jgi:hypothetical protein
MNDTTGRGWDDKEIANGDVSHNMNNSGVTLSTGWQRSLED